MNVLFEKNSQLVTRTVGNFELIHLSFSKILKFGRLNQNLVAVIQIGYLVTSVER